MNLEEAIRVCRKPVKEDRIAMCGHILQAVAYIHQNNLAHTSLGLRHTLVEVEYPWVIKVPYVKRAFVSSTGYATESTRELMDKDLEDLVHVLACVMYWYKIDPKEKGEWIHTFRSRHPLASQLMTVVSRYKSFQSALEMMREWCCVAALGRA
jgi:hypothetical protein